MIILFIPNLMYLEAMAYEYLTLSRLGHERGIFMQLVVHVT